MTRLRRSVTAECEPNRRDRDAQQLVERAPHGVAGPDGRPVVAHVESLTLVTPDGLLRRIDRLTSGGLFALALGGQGLFGTLYSATLRVESLLRSVKEGKWKTRGGYEEGWIVDG